MKLFAAPSLILASTSWSEHQQFAFKENTIYVPGESWKFLQEISQEKNALWGSC